MRRLPLALVLLLALAPLACGGDAADSAAEAMREAADAVRDAADNLSSDSDARADADDDSDSDAPPLTAMALQERLTDELGGLDRVSTERQSMGAAGLDIATAKATYEDDGKTLEVTLMSGAGILMGPAMAFRMVDFDRTTESGYERTIQLHGHKGMQSYEEDGDYRRAELTLLVDDRVLIRLESEGMTMEELEEVLEDLDLESMEG